MPTTSSADGTVISYDATGDGPGVVIAGGAFSVGRDAGEIAAALAASGFRAITYDRRARAGSGDTPPYAPEREAEDLAAVVAAAGGVAAGLGHSSGAMVVLLAAALGVEIPHVFLSEPPFRFGDGPREDLPERLQALVDAGERPDAVVLFQREGVELPEEMIEQIRSSPMFDALVPLAQSTVYDATLSRAVSPPPPELLAVGMPVTVLCGAQTFPLLAESSRRIATLIPQAEFVEVAEFVGHRVDPETAARVIRERIG